MTTRLVSVIGLAFGDCGKGLFTDYLCQQWQAHTVVRFNGGAQAGHNVVLADGRHHTFSQFAAGSLRPGVLTLLAQPMVVHPSALLVEQRYLQALGVHDAWQRMLIDGRCRVTTPYLQAAGRIRELARGAQAHGSCGVGVGETVRHSLQHAAQTVHYTELVQPALLFAKLEAQRRQLLAEVSQLSDTTAFAAEMALLQDASIAQRWYAMIAPLGRLVPAASKDQLAARLHQPGTVLFEGAQGVLLDEWRGFHPHTSWSSIGPQAVNAVAQELGQNAPIKHLGVLRSYLTRHGQGPLPSHDVKLDVLPEAHNTHDGWQGVFRRGQPDALLLRYALSVTGKLDGLLLSHMDALSQVGGLQWCQAYQAPQHAQDAQLCQRDANGHICALKLGELGDLQHQAGLTQLLSQAQAQYPAPRIQDASAMIASVTEIAQCPVLLAGFGATCEQVKILPAFAAI